MHAHTLQQPAPAGTTVPAPQPTQDFHFQVATVLLEERAVPGLEQNFAAPVLLDRTIAGVEAKHAHDQ
jgi:hypothetical protein